MDAPKHQKYFRHKPLRELCVNPSATIQEALLAVERSGKGVALVIDKNWKFLGLITDGDLRRYILTGASTQLPISQLLWPNGRNEADSHASLAAEEGASQDELLALMKEHVIRHVPLLNKEGQLRDLVTLPDLITLPKKSLQSVIMAGGFGVRLRPLTQSTPKPMLPIGDKPLMELTVEKLKEAGIKHVNVTSHYLSDQITEHFGDGSNFGVHIKYHEEKSPLGTAGALSGLADSESPLLVVNGDIITDLNFREMHAFHEKHGALLTVGVRKYEISVPYGVIKTEGTDIVGIEEKPTLQFFINAGIYIIEPKACAMIPKNRKYDMPDLIRKLSTSNKKVVTFPIHEYWIDIGSHPDYSRAQDERKAS